MDASHILVGGLTCISLALLVWMEIRSRRNSAIQEQTARRGGGGPVARQEQSPQAGRSTQEKQPPRRRPRVQFRSSQHQDVGPRETPPLSSS